MRVPTTLLLVLALCAFVPISSLHVQRVEEPRPSTHKRYTDAPIVVEGPSWRAKRTGEEESEEEEESVDYAEEQGDDGQDDGGEEEGDGSQDDGGEEEGDGSQDDGGEEEGDGSQEAAVDTEKSGAGGDWTGGDGEQSESDSSSIDGIFRALDKGDIRVDQAAERIDRVVEDIVGDTDNRTQAKRDAVEVLRVCSDLLTVDSVSEEAGSVFLSALDTLALGVFDEDVLVETENIKLVVKSVDANGTNLGSNITAIDYQGALIVLPPQLFEVTQLSSGRIASYFYTDLAGLLPSYSEGDNKTLLLSPVISSKLECGTEEPQCDTRHLNLTVPVTISVIHPQAKDENHTTCVFWEFTESNQTNSSLTGYWSQEGCTRNDKQSTATKTVCECTHLTHFAVLLSPGAEYDSDHVLALQSIGYVGIGISLLALLITIITFAMLRSLWNIRNYIHVNLCISLMNAQLVFVIGVDKTENSNGCAAVAVLLHYFFLVTFMWMLMEGVVLYIMLVKVFVVEFRKKHLTLTAVFSYGVPALYMGLSVPLGFLLNNTRHYGSDSACWLRYDTHFVWAFIAPVLLIILINIGFFVMAMVVIKKHRSRKRSVNKAATIKHWIRVPFSLLVVMGITWVVGVLTFHEDLLPVAYIFTFFVAFQGLVIFIVFILLSKQVRDAYITWLKTRVEGSDVLTKMFGSKLGTLTTSTARSRKENIAQYYLTMRMRSRSASSYVSSPVPATVLSRSLMGENSSGLRRIVEGGNDRAMSFGDDMGCSTPVFDPIKAEMWSPAADSGVGDELSNE